MPPWFGVPEVSQPWVVFTVTTSQWLGPCCQEMAPVISLSPACTGSSAGCRTAAGFCLLGAEPGCDELRGSLSRAGVPGISSGSAEPWL